jgi:uncharacterized protein YgiM (DUF1202 family)
MRLNSKALGATLGVAIAAAMVAPALAQDSPPPGAQEMPPAAPQNMPPPGVLPPGSPPPQVAPPQAGPMAPGPGARSAFATANVNLRSGPGTDSEVIATIPGGSRLQIASCEGEWCAVTWNGRSGYAIARNLGAAPRQARAYRPQPGYAEGSPGYEDGPPVVYGAPRYYGPPAVVYGPGYYGYGGYYGPGYGCRRRW